MCRWLAYAGPPVYPEAFLFEAEHSLIEQSMHARMGATPTNGDGFGLGWYLEREDPGLFRDILPAWNDDNLKSVAAHMRSPLFFAHVRAATGGGISRNNCHPFRYGRWLFMHNGQIGNFDKVRREIDCMISDDYYHHRHGTTDSETFFCLLLTNGLEDDVETAFRRSIEQVEEVMAQEGATRAFRLTAAATDGETVYAVRYASDDKAPTLFVGLDAPEMDDCAVMVLSEPLDSCPDHWQAVDASQFVTVRRGVFEVQDFPSARQVKEAG
jgi:predicted glutamine amidotransferase